ncbi:MAG: stage II sporulation protein M [Bacteroidetes bacterium]|nr:stage II sporulation protein M [Bacteroidota bacterium]
MRKILFFVKEITFLKQNASKWEGYETMLEKKAQNKPAKVADMFIELTDDYSYAKTNYEGSKTAKYLNSLTARVHQLVYRNKKENSRRIFLFWKSEVPTLFGKYHHLLLLSFLIFSGGAILGAISQLTDDSFARLMLSDDYVNETIERIKRGDPLGIYGEMPNWFMYFYITTNNIYVSFYIFAMGALFSLGNTWLLLKEGIRLGAFFGMFYQYNVFDKALKVVWIHGSLEISAIIIAGCAGYILGNSFMFPGTFKRTESFKRGAKDGIKVLIGLIPVFMCAGFLESFVTRYTNMPLWASLSIIIGSMGFIFWYFILLPFLLKRKNNAG